MAKFVYDFYTKAVGDMSAAAAKEAKARETAAALAAAEKAAAAEAQPGPYEAGGGVAERGLSSGSLIKSLPLMDVWQGRASLAEAAAGESGARVAPDIEFEDVDASRVRPAAEGAEDAAAPAPAE